MWIGGLNAIRKPFAHLHMQFEQKIPCKTMDMDYMNTNQSAHGGREFGYIATRMGIKRKVIAGHWRDDKVLEGLNDWIRAALGWYELQNLRIARFGDNMRYVAVTEGNKVDAQIELGYEVHGYALGDLLEYINGVEEHEVERLLRLYKEEYCTIKGSVSDDEIMASLREAAKVEIGMRQFLEQGSFKAFTTTFENLHGLGQLPGLACQRLMRDGYGFGAEGDWKSAALVRIMKVMALGNDLGTSFIEDYVYHLEPGNTKELGAHMLEVCESIANDKPTLKVHPLSIGGKAAPARSVFTAKEGPAIQVCMVGFGDRFRVIVNEVDVVKQEEDMPSLPVARALWVPRPDLATAATAWILSGGAHHSCLSYSVSTEQIEDLCEILGVELVIIDSSTNIRDLKRKLRDNEIYYKLKNI
ncbi:MAG TPA: L-arabinose isomerase [Kosmotogaceae bacterium]|nr:L-arabinose isomerase [Kosmotogaceae bacterium]